MTQIVINPRTDAEISAGITPTSYEYPAGDIRRYGSTTASSDNTASIQQAVDQCADGGAPVYVPPGVWNVVQIAVATGLEMYGDGYNSCIRLADTGNQYVIANTNGSVYVDDVYIHNLRIDGNKANNTSGGGILLNGRRNRITNNYVHDTVKACVQIGTGSNGMINTPNAGQHVIAHNICVNPGSANSWGAIGVTHGSDINICNNICISTDGQMTYGIDVEPNSGNACHRIIISNNNINGGRIFVDCAHMSAYSDGNVVTGNVVDARNSYDPSQTNAAPLFIRQCSDLVISNNVCYGHDSAVFGGIFFEISGLTTAKCVVNLLMSGNSFRSDNTGVRPGYFNKVDSAVITNNTWNVTSSANTVELLDTTDARLSTNRVSNSGTGSSLNTSGTCTNGWFALSNYTVGAINNTATGFTLESIAAYLTASSTPTLTGTWRFTGSYNSFEGATDNIVLLKATSASTDLKNWILRATSAGRFAVSSISDDLSNVRTALEINKTSAIGITSMVYGNSTDSPPHIFNGQIRQGSSSGVALIVGTGDPSGSVTAPVGSIFQRSDGGAGSSMYVKESGTGNTGWVAK